MFDSVDEGFLPRATKVVEENMHEADFHVEALASALHMSRSALYLKLKALVDQAPQTFIRTLRLKRSAQLLCEDAANISEIAAKVGFLEPTHFSRDFKTQFGVSPSQYRDACGE
jgi:AraC-like DNA-binding protein